MNELYTSVLVEMFCLTQEIFTLFGILILCVFVCVCVCVTTSMVGLKNGHICKNLT